MTFGSAQPQLTIGLLNDFYIPIPSTKEQIQISSALDSVCSKLSKIKSKHQSAILLKKALMQDLLTGKVRVKTD